LWFGGGERTREAESATLILLIAGSVFMDSPALGCVVIGDGHVIFMYVDVEVVVTWLPLEVLEPSPRTFKTSVKAS
jgi:hypothetical protein